MSNDFNSNSFFAKLAGFILAWRWLLMVAVLFLTAFFLYEMRGLKMDNSNEAFFVEGDRTLATYHRFHDTFGNDEFVYILFEPKLSDFLLNLRRSLAHKGFAKILDISTGMPAVFANPYASRSQHISSQKIAQLRLKQRIFSTLKQLSLLPRLPLTWKKMYLM